ncbi:MAG: hypothetical protein ACW99Q_23665, partial [Candidatus Kariarchaeaceae archaeon]
ENTEFNTYIDHIVYLHDTHEPNVTNLKFRWYSIFSGDISVRISLFQVGTPEMVEKFTWENVTEFKIDQGLITQTKFTWIQNESARELDEYKLDLLLSWYNIVVSNLIEVNITEFIKINNRFILDTSLNEMVTAFNNGSQSLIFTGIRNDSGDKLIQIGIISDDFDPLNIEILWELNSDPNLTDEGTTQIEEEDYIVEPYTITIIPLVSSPPTTSLVSQDINNDGVNFVNNYLILSAILFSTFVHKYKNRV